MAKSRDLDKFNLRWCAVVAFPSFLWCSYLYAVWCLAPGRPGSYSWCLCCRVSPMSRVLPMSTASHRDRGGVSCTAVQATACRFFRIHVQVVLGILARSTARGNKRGRPSAHSRRVPKAYTGMAPKLGIAIYRLSPRLIFDGKDASLWVF